MQKRQTFEEVLDATLLNRGTGEIGEHIDEILFGELDRLEVQIPLVIGGEEIYTEEKAQQLCPYQHERVISEVGSLADDNHIEKAIKVAISPERNGN